MTTPPPLTAGELVAILAILTCSPAQPHLIARIRALLDAAPDPQETP